VQLAVLVEADRTVLVGEQHLEVVEVAGDVGVNHGEALGERARHPGQFEGFRASGGPVFDGDEVGGGVGVAA